MATSPSPARRLTTYWKIEAGNAVLIPALAVYMVLRSGGKISTALVLSGLACSFLLVIGTIVLRMMLRKARGEATATADWLPLLIRMRWPAIGLCVAAAIANGADWISGNAGLSAQFVAPAVLLLLAVLSAVAVAAIPGGSLPLIAGLLATFGIDPAGIGIILGVDRILDMCRTATNVGCDLTTAVVVDSLVKKSEAKAAARAA